MGEGRTFVLAKRGWVLDENITFLEFSKPVKVTFIRRATPKYFLTRDGRYRYEVHSYVDVHMEGGRDE
jgi:hypothetical protein